MPVARDGVHKPRAGTPTGPASASGIVIFSRVSQQPCGQTQERQCRRILPFPLGPLTMDTFSAGRTHPRRAPRRDTGSDIPMVRWPTLVEPSVSLPGRVDVTAAAAGLRHLDASTEPALVFSQLAAVWVPAVCDDVIIDLVENGHGYRIRQPAVPAPVPPLPPNVPASRSRSDGPVLGAHTVTVSIDSDGAAAVGLGFTGTLICSWSDGYRPVTADASLIGLAVDYAVALIHRERLTSKAAGLQGPAQTLSNTLSRNRRIASAVGVVMALHHVDQTQAMNLLIRISERTDRDLQNAADSVIHTRTVPRIRPH